MSLLAQGVVAPGAASLLLSQQAGKEVLQVTISNQDLDGLKVRDLRLPPGVLLVELQRERSVLLVTGQTSLRRGDEVTLIAHVDAESEIKMMLEERSEPPSKMFEMST